MEGDRRRGIEDREWEKEGVGGSGRKG